MTGWLRQTMQANAAGIGQVLAGYTSGDIVDWAAANIAWTDLVKSGGPWDFKPDLQAREMDTVSLAGKEWNYQIVANVHFGYVGMAAGFSSDWLLGGAGAAQLLGGHSKPAWASTCFDDPADRAAILAGIYLYETYGQYGIPPSDEMLAEALALYEQDLVWEE